jgi:hypothetical protein
MKGYSRLNTHTLYLMHDADFPGSPQFPPGGQNQQKLRLNFQEWRHDGLCWTLARLVTLARLARLATLARIVRVTV